MANDLTRNKQKLAMSHVIYEIKCPRGDYVLPNPSYIGQTRNTLKTRLTQHRQNGAIVEHMTNVHNNTTLTLEDLADKVKIVKQIRELRKWQSMKH